MLRPGQAEDEEEKKKGDEVDKQAAIRSLANFDDSKLRKVSITTNRLLFTGDRAGQTNQNVYDLLS